MTQPGRSFVADASSEYAAQLVVKVKEMLLPPLSRLVMRRELAKDYADIVPRLRVDQWRRGRGEQETMVRFECDPPSKRCQLLDDNESDGALTLFSRSERTWRRLRSA